MVTKKYFIITMLSFVLVMGLIVGFNVLSANASSNTEDMIFQAAPSETIAYAAALSTLPENEGNSKTENINIAKAYFQETNELNKDYEEYLVKHSSELQSAQISSDRVMKEQKINDTQLTLEQLPEKDRKAIKAKNAMIESLHAELAQIEEQYGIDELPILFYSIEEVLGGIEDGLLYKEMIADMVRERGYLEASGYSMDDFENIYSDSIAAEIAVRDQIQADPDPDLYTYSVMLYQAREDFPMIF